MTVDTRTGEVMMPLTDSETLALNEAEATIETGLKTFVEVGQALALIRDSRLYRAEYATFEAYCGDRWHLSRPRAYQLIEAAEVVEALSTNVDTPLPRTESQARELSGLPATEAAATMRTAHESTGGNVTAKAIREARAVTAQSIADGYVEQFPALSFFYDRGEYQRVNALGRDLADMDEGELARRLDVLGKTIAAERREAEGVPHPEPHTVVTLNGAKRDIPDEQIARGRALVARHEQARNELALFITEHVLAIHNHLAGVTDLAGDIDYDHLPAFEEVRDFLADLIAAVKEF